MPSRRLFNAAGFLTCAALLGYGYFLQFVQGLEPCPLCSFQRVAYYALAILFLVAAVHAPRRAGARVYGVLIGVAALTGAGVAARHVWLQSLPPDRLPACGPGLDYMLETFPFGETLKLVFTGSGECGEVAWSFLGLSIPAWALVWFALLAVIGVARNFMRE